MEDPKPPKISPWNYSGDKTTNRFLYILQYVVSLVLHPQFRMVLARLVAYRYSRLLIWQEVKGKIEICSSVILSLYCPLICDLMRISPINLCITIQCWLLRLAHSLATNVFIVSPPKDSYLKYIINTTPDTIIQRPTSILPSPLLD